MAGIAGILLFLVFVLLQPVLEKKSPFVKWAVFLLLVLVGVEIAQYSAHHPCRSDLCRDFHWDGAGD